MGIYILQTFCIKRYYTLRCVVYTITFKHFIYRIVNINTSHTSSIWLYRVCSMTHPYIFNRNRKNHSFRSLQNYYFFFVHLNLMVHENMKNKVTKICDFSNHSNVLHLLYLLLIRE